MSRKLPKAVGQTLDELRRAGATEQPAEPEAAVPPPAAARRRKTTASASAAPPAVEPDIEKPAAPEEQTAPALPVPVTSAPAAPARRAEAEAIVRRHATYAAVGGLIPLPLIDVASVTAINVRMVSRLARHYGVPFQHDRMRAIVIALMGGAAPTGLAAVTTTTLMRLTPGASLAGLAVSSLTAAACTRGIGQFFLGHFEAGGGLPDLAPRA
jgi:uncharacterized protein (DUF697 family)